MSRSADRSSEMTPALTWHTTRAKAFCSKFLVFSLKCTGCVCAAACAAFAGPTRLRSHAQPCALQPHPACRCVRRTSARARLSGAVCCPSTAARHAHRRVFASQIRWPRPARCVRASVLPLGRPRGAACAYLRICGAPAPSRRGGGARTRRQGWRRPGEHPRRSSPRPHGRPARCRRLENRSAGHRSA